MKAYTNGAPCVLQRPRQLYVDLATNINTVTRRYHVIGTERPDHGYHWKGTIAFFSVYDRYEMTAAMVDSLHVAATAAIEDVTVPPAMSPTMCHDPCQPPRCNSCCFQRHGCAWGGGRCTGHYACCGAGAEPPGDYVGDGVCTGWSTTGRYGPAGLSCDGDNYCSDVAELSDCHQMCEDRAGCRFYSYGWTLSMGPSKNCMLYSSCDDPSQSLPSYGGYKSYREEFSTVPNAQVACRDDPSCGWVYDWRCDDSGATHNI
eukprot:gene57899-biopygen108840